MAARWPFCASATLGWDRAGFSGVWGTEWDTQTGWLEESSRNGQRTEWWNCKGRRWGWPRQLPYCRGRVKRNASRWHHVLQGGQACAGAPLVRTRLRLAVSRSRRAPPHGQRPWHGLPEGAVKAAAFQCRLDCEHSPETSFSVPTRWWRSPRHWVTQFWWHLGCFLLSDWFRKDGWTSGMHVQK